MTRAIQGTRVANLGANVDSCAAVLKGNGSSTYDVCMDCLHKLEQDPHVFNEKLKPYNGDPQGVDGWGDDVDHPPYGDGDDDMYRCAVCRVFLKD